MQQVAKRFRFLIQKLLNGSKPFFRSTFHHITRERPRGTGKAQNRNFAADRLYDAADRFGQEPGFQFRVENPQFLNVCQATNRAWKVRPLIAQLEWQSHGFGRNEDIGEDDHGIDAEPSERLQGDLRGQLRGLANLQKSMLCANFAILGQVDRKSTRLNSSHPSISYAVFCLKKKTKKTSNKK